MKVPAIAGTTLTPEQVVEKLKTIDKHKSVVEQALRRRADGDREGDPGG